MLQLKNLSKACLLGIEVCWLISHVGCLRMLFLISCQFSRQMMMEDTLLASCNVPQRHNGLAISNFGTLCRSFNGFAPRWAACKLWHRP